MVAYSSFESIFMNFDGLSPQIRVSYCLALDIATNISLRSSL